MATATQALTLQIDIFKHGDQFHAEIQNYDTGETFVGETVGSLNEAVTTVVNSAYPAGESDDDPQCTNCGVYRSEHALLRASDCDGFTTKPGGSIVYTSSDLAEMSPDEIDDLFGRGDYDLNECDEDEPEACVDCFGTGFAHTRIYEDGFGLKASEVLPEGVDHGGSIDAEMTDEPCEICNGRGYEEEKAID